MARSRWSLLTAKSDRLAIQMVAVSDAPDLSRLVAHASDLEKVRRDALHEQRETAHLR
jgi:hypothetical protein